MPPSVAAPPPSFASLSFRTEPQIYLVSVGNFELFEGWWILGWTKPSWAPCLVGWWRVGRWLGRHQWLWDGSMHGGSGGWRRVHGVTGGIHWEWQPWGVETANQRYRRVVWLERGQDLWGGPRVLVPLGVVACLLLLVLCMVLVASVRSATTMGAAIGHIRRTLL